MEVKIRSEHRQYRSSNVFFPSSSFPCVVTGGSIGRESEMLGVFQTQGCLKGSNVLERLAVKGEASKPTLASKVRE